MKGLKPCPNPWCSPAYTRSVRKHLDRNWVRCMCGLCGPVVKGPREAVEAWNNRPREQLITEALRYAAAALAATGSTTEGSNQAYRKICAALADERSKLVNDQEIVKSKWPEAVSRLISARCTYVQASYVPMARILGVGGNEEEAWADAAKKIKEPACQSS